MIYNLPRAKKDTSETWVIVEDPPINGGDSFSVDINFSSNGEEFTQFTIGYN